ncbi:Bgt-50630 [Blumeria graminis f. sp. tritici]|uniref:Bgt-50630 n=1 Tax=Blumeria graminis f. sp. tritici TaxID=62690 RepID=A0A9X9QCX8_BLUGR|nr:Bgt-50630 [Blumeria graminis f. sp. tritici]
MHESEAGRQEALAWNQGQLQLFRRESFLHSWAEATKVGYEPYTGRLIANFIQSHNAQVKKFVQKFTIEDGESCVPHCFGIPDKISLGHKGLLTYRLKNMPGKVKRLVPVPADGKLYGVKICEPTEWPVEGFSKELLEEFMTKREMSVQ